VLVGRGTAVEHAGELLALSGIGRVSLLLPQVEETGPAGDARDAEAFVRAVRNRNPSSQVETAPLQLRSGDPTAPLRGVSAAAACLDDSAEEQLLQAACRMLRIPVVLGGAEGLQGQVTTVLPGDPGIALVYRPTHPHLEPRRSSREAARETLLMVGTWLAEEVTAALLGSEELLRDTLLFVDLRAGELARYPLRG
jgi:molybdopterin/thiamine biosynthesis adenylyltransferase